MLTIEYWMRHTIEYAESGGLHGSPPQDAEIAASLTECLRLAKIGAETERQQAARGWKPAFDEQQCGGAFDGSTVTSDAAPGL